MKPISDDLLECIVLVNCPISSSDNPPGPFHTGDIFVPHPTLAGRWRLIGWRDDVINMSFSESFVALPFEDQMRSHPLADEAVVFGNGRLKLGLFVFGSEYAKRLTSEEVVQRIWVTVEEMNVRNQPWTRVEREMVVAIPYGTSWPKTDKQNVIRPKVYKEFEREINERYERLDEKEIVEPHWERQVLWRTSSCRRRRRRRYSGCLKPFPAGVYNVTMKRWNSASVDHLHFLYCSSTRNRYALGLASCQFHAMRKCECFFLAEQAI